ncbi:TetR/AcrR family transcriptional regulator [Pedococcus soli]
MPEASPAAVSPTTSTAPRTARREATRGRLLAAAEEVFAERGFHGASVEDLCERAHFTRGAFYSNFASKDELVLELYAAHASALRQRIAEVAERPGLSLEQVLEAVFDVWTDDPESRRRWHLLTSEFALHALRDEEARAAWAGAQAAIRDELVALVDRIAAAQGLHPAVSTTDLVRLISLVFQGGLGQHLLDPGSVPAGSLEREFLPLLIRAATSRDPRADR